MFEDRTPTIPEDQAADRQQIAYPVVLGAPVALSAWAEHLCPPEDEWRPGGFISCGADLDDPLDYLHSDSIIFKRRFHPPVRLGVGDVYTATSPPFVADEPLADGTIGYRFQITREILGFSEPYVDIGGMWAWVTPEVKQTSVCLYDMASGAVEPWTVPGSPFTGPAQRWVQVGGEAGRALAPDGALASGLLAVNVDIPPDVPAPC